MKQSKKILLAEDEEVLRNIIAESLAVRGFVVTETGRGDEALTFLANDDFDIAVLDVMMPAIDGFSLVKKMRADNIQIPVLFLTSKTLPAEVVEGFESGGNDYLKKPFAMEELVIRIRSLLGATRILPPVQARSIPIGQYVFLPVRQQLSRGDKVISLTARESSVLEILVSSGQMLVNRKQLLMEIWGDDNFFNARTLDVFITKLRKYLRDDPHVQIINVRGLGYKLVW